MNKVVFCTVSTSTVSVRYLHNLINARTFLSATYELEEEMLHLLD
jgi:hypothetical protein